MKTGPNNDSAPDMRPEENDPLWSLLARAPMPEPDAWFTTRTLARCRSEKTTSFSIKEMGGVWRWVIGSGLGFCLVVILVVAQIHSDTVNHQRNVQEAFEVMASFGTDPDSPSPWQDPSP